MYEVNKTDTHTTCPASSLRGHTHTHWHTHTHILVYPVEKEPMTFGVFGGHCMAEDFAFPLASSQSPAFESWLLCEKVLLEPPPLRPFCNHSFPRPAQQERESEQAREWKERAPIDSQDVWHVSKYS